SEADQGGRRMSVGIRAEIAVRGVRVDAPVRRPAGAGPSDDGHLVVDGANAALPVNPDSPYLVRDGRLWLGDSDTGLAVQVVRRPRFYDLSTVDGVPYERIARLHGADVLAPTVLRALKDAGTTAIGIHVESLDDAVRRKWTPGKATVPLRRYEEAWDEAVRVFGPNRVSTYLLVGLGEDPDELIAGAGRLIERG